MKNTILFFFAFLAACSAAPQKIQASSEEKEDLIRKVVKCAISATKQLDDGISPANTVAAVVINNCRSEIDASDRAIGAIGGKFELTWEERKAKLWIDDISEIVLTERAKKKNGSK